MKTQKTIETELQEIKKLLAVQTDEPLTIEGACQLTGYKKSYIYKLCSLKSIPFFKPNNKKVYFSKNELKAWLFRNKQKSNSEIDAEADIYINRLRKRT
ncbi:MAG: helix-turn-helix domain-containing protein [Ignavibacteriae bacterium]|nr:helix-turn-helix domain-containing protein [Ignavibacteriota bacterium]